MFKGQETPAQGSVGVVEPELVPVPEVDPVPEVEPVPDVESVPELVPVEPEVLDVPEELSPSVTEQSAPENPALHSHTPLTQYPFEEQELGHEG